MWVRTCVYVHDAHCLPLIYTLATWADSATAITAATTASKPDLWRAWVCPVDTRALVCTASTGRVLEATVTRRSEWEFEMNFI